MLRRKEPKHGDGKKRLSCLYIGKICFMKSNVQDVQGKNKKGIEEDEDKKLFT